LLYRIIFMSFVSVGAGKMPNFIIQYCTQRAKPSFFPLINY